MTGNNPTELTDFQRDNIDAALQDALEAKGFVFVDKTADADLLLSWHLNLMEKTDVKAYNNPSYQRQRCTMSASRNTPRDTFIIDMIDPDENASVWRSVTQSKLKDETIRDQAAPDSANAGTRRLPTRRNARLSVTL